MSNQRNHHSQNGNLSIVSEDESSQQNVDLDSEEESEQVEVNIPPTSDAERREIRNQYRNLLDVVEGFAEDIEVVNPDVLAEQIKISKLIYADVVKRNLSVEGSSDAQFINRCSDVTKRKTSVMPMTFEEFNAEDYANQLIKFLKNDNDDEARDAGCFTSDEDVATSSSTVAASSSQRPTSQRRSVNVEILSKRDWTNFGRRCSGLFKIAYCPNFLSANMDKPAPRAKLERKAHAPRQKDAIAEAVQPKDVTFNNDGGTGEDEKTTKMINNVLNCLNVTYVQLDNLPVPYFEFIINPTSFSKSVENMFYFSFLVKTGKAKLLFMNNEQPVIVPINNVETISNETSHDEVDTNQCMMSLKYSEWEEIVDAFQITEALIP